MIHRRWVPVVKPDDVTECERIGDGNHSYVYKIRINNKFYALKIVTTSLLSNVKDDGLSLVEMSQSSPETFLVPTKFLRKKSSK